MRLPERRLPPAAARQVSGVCPSCGRARRVGGRRRCTANRRRRRTCSGGLGLGPASRPAGATRCGRRTGPRRLALRVPARSPPSPPSAGPAARPPPLPGAPPAEVPFSCSTRIPNGPRGSALIHAAGPYGLVTSRQPGDCDFSPQPASLSPGLHGFSEERAQTHPSPPVPGRGAQTLPQKRACPPRPALTFGRGSQAFSLPRAQGPRMGSPGCGSAVRKGETPLASPRNLRPRRLRAALLEPFWVMGKDAPSHAVSSCWCPFTGPLAGVALHAASQVGPAA